MKILGIDTTAKVSTAALMCNGIIICEMNLNNGLTHSQTIMSIVNSVLKFSSVSLDEIDIFAVTTGPGSFTGVRIGVSLVKGLAFPRNTKCMGLSSLEALAYNMYGIDAYICPVMDARRSQVYTALFEFRDGGMVRLMEDDILKIENLGEKIKNLSKPVFFLGDGSELCYNVLENVNRNFKIASKSIRYQKGASVCLLANELLEKYGDEHILYSDTLLPSYLRPSQAEREYVERNNNG